MPHIWEVLDPPKFPTNFPREIQKNFWKSRGKLFLYFYFFGFS